MRKKSLKELKSSQKRHAVASLRGYAYQIWESVYRWVNLKENEVIFLEGAEDLDVLGPERAETIQVKYTKKSKSVTLRSKEILEAIVNFWKHQKNNPNSKVEFHFLTTADRGQEHHSPFGSKCGLDYWDSCKRHRTDLAPLRTFLASQEIFPIELRKFIRESEASKLRERLIKRINWNTGNKPKEYLENLIERAVCYHGDRLGIFPSESKKVVPHLLKYVWDVICRESNRRLEYHDFMELFEKVTTVTVPLQELTLLKQASQLTETIRTFIRSSVFPRTAGKVQPSTEFQLLPPLLPDKLIRREKLVSKLHERLETNGILVLKGSTGMGKSILARFMVGENENDWRWLNVRGLMPDQIKELFFKETIALGHYSRDIRLVIDDLKFGHQSTIYECALEGLLYAVLSYSGKIIITTQEEIPNRIIQNLQIPTESFVDVPTMSLEEVKKLAIVYGCNGKSNLEAWPAIIKAKTQGHPQLVHAWIKSLEAKNWPAFTIDDFAKEEDIESVRREARKNLVAQLPSKEARSFVYKIIGLHKNSF